MIDSHYALLRIGRVVEERAQLDAAMPELREVKGVPIARIKVRGSIVRRKDNQRVQECDHTRLLLGRQLRECSSSNLTLTSVTHNHLHQINTASIMAVWSS